MELYVVRHANAGRRSTWDGDDDERPLSKKGRKQAAAIGERLATTGVDRLVSSPTLRCVQTLEPLAKRLGTAIDVDQRLLEGATGDDALELAAELAGTCTGAVVCSHGDVIPELLRTLYAGTTRIADPLVWPKGSIWAVTWDGESWSTARYLPPPEI
jgi:8-oxo-dGTP diphosphatase